MHTNALCFCRGCTIKYKGTEFCMIERNVMLNFTVVQLHFWKISPKDSSAEIKRGANSLICYTTLFNVMLNPQNVQATAWRMT